MLQAVVHSGSALATENRIVQAQLADLRAQTQAQEEQIEALSHALLGVEDSTRNDPETGALNAQGLQEALLTEAARNQRQAQPTTLAALRIDQLAALEAETARRPRLRPWYTWPDWCAPPCARKMPSGASASSSSSFFFLPQWPPRLPRHWPACSKNSASAHCCWTIAPYP